MLYEHAAVAAGMNSARGAFREGRISNMYGGMGGMGNMAGMMKKVQKLQSQMKTM